MSVNIRRDGDGRVQRVDAAAGAAGVIAGGSEALQPPQTAVGITVAEKGGAVTRSDAPFAEAKEVIGGSQQSNQVHATATTVEERAVRPGRAGSTCRRVDSVSANLTDFVTFADTESSQRGTDLAQGAVRRSCLTVTRRAERRDRSMPPESAGAADGGDLIP